MVIVYECRQDVYNDMQRKEGKRLMTNTELLREKIEQSGYKLQFIAKKVGITYQGLLNKINNKSEFRANEIQALYDLLGLSEAERVAIFFAERVD